MSIIVAASPLELFPECPGYGFTAQPQYLVNVAGQDSGFEDVNKRWPRPLLYFTAVPFDARDEADAYAILNFWHCVKGTAEKFRVRDETDYKSCQVQDDFTAADQPLEVVSLTGGGTGYQLVKLYTIGGLTQQREITQPDGPTVLVANALGVPQTDFMLDQGTGVLVPGGSFSGVPTSWGGEFYVPVRFDSQLTIVVQDERIESVSFTMGEALAKLSTAVPVLPPGHGIGAAHMAFSASASGADVSPGAAAAHMTFGSSATGMTSSGGGGPIVWTALASPPGTMAGAAVDGSGHILAGNALGSVYRTSDDGTWVSLLNNANAVQCLGFGNGIFMGGRTGSSVKTSTNAGTSWSPPISIGAAIGTITSLATNGSGRWVALSTGGTGPGDTYAFSTDDGNTWTKPATLVVGGWYNQALIWDSVHSQFVAFGAQQTTFQPALYLSSDGSTWTEHVFGPEVASLGCWAFDGTHFLLGLGPTSTANSVRIVTDPINFITDTGVATGVGGVGTTDTSTKPVGIVSGDGIMFVFGNQGSVFSSTDSGATWTQGTLNFGGTNAPRASAVVYDSFHKTFLAVSANGANQARYVGP